LDWEPHVSEAGTHWVIEQSFEATQGEAGLDYDGVRRWTRWYRPIGLAMWALALLVALREGTVAVQVLRKNLPPAPKPASLAPFKAHPGFPSP
jgi:hypothetical protein